MKSIVPTKDSELMQDVVHDSTDIHRAVIESGCRKHVQEVVREIEELPVEKRIREARRLRRRLAAGCAWSSNLRKKQAAVGNEIRAARHQY